MSKTHSNGSARYLSTKSLSCKLDRCEEFRSLRFHKGQIFIIIDEWEGPFAPSFETAAEQDEFIIQAYITGASWIYPSGCCDACMMNSSCSAAVSKLGANGPSHSSPIPSLNSGGQSQLGNGLAHYGKD